MTEYRYPDDFLQPGPPPKLQRGDQVSHPRGTDGPLTVWVDSQGAHLHAPRHDRVGSILYPDGVRGQLVRVFGLGRYGKCGRVPKAEMWGPILRAIARYECCVSINPTIEKEEP
jgi:hypothetical protein